MNLEVVNMKRRMVKDKVRWYIETTDGAGVI